MIIQPEQTQPADRPVQFVDALRVVAQLIKELNFQGDPELPDAAQDTLLRALQSWDQFHGRTEDELQVWLRQILRHRLTDLARIRNRRKSEHHCSLDQGSASLGLLLIDDGSTPSHKAIRGERSSLVCEALDRLPDEQRTAIVLRYMYELPIEEICPLIGRTPPGVAGLLRRGLCILRQDLTKNLQRGSDET